MLARTPQGPGPLRRMPRFLVTPGGWLGCLNNKVGYNHCNPGFRRGYRTPKERLPFVVSCNPSEVVGSMGCLRLASLANPDSIAMNASYMPATIADGLISSKLFLLGHYLGLVSLLPFDLPLDWLSCLKGQVERVLKVFKLCHWLLGRTSVNPRPRICKRQGMIFLHFSKFLILA